VEGMIVPNHFTWFLKAALLCLLSFLSLSACVSSYKVVVTVSPEVKTFYNGWPSLEVDVAAVSDADASALEKIKNEDYFAPNSALRAKIEPKTFYFTEEDTARAKLGSRDDLWKDWLKNKATTLFVIASLPSTGSGDTSAQGQNADPDPRSLFVKMKRSYIIARTIRVEVEPQKISREKKEKKK
jgi:hypothetical protein